MYIWVPYRGSMLRRYPYTHYLKALVFNKEPTTTIFAPLSRALIVALPPVLRLRLLTTLMSKRTGRELTADFSMRAGVVKALT